MSSGAPPGGSDDPEPVTVGGPSAELRLRTSSPAQTAQLAARIAPLLRGGDLLLLAGDLGAGKTTFTKGLAAALGVAETVTSPTFTLVRSYACSVPGLRTLVHADLFRLENLSELRELGIEELLDAQAVAVVEWGDVAAPLMGAGALVLAFSHGDGEDERLVSVVPGGDWEDRRDALEGALCGLGLEGTRAARRGQE